MARVAATNRIALKKNHINESPTRVLKFAAHGLAAAAWQLTACTATVDTSIKRIEDSTLKLSVSDNTFAQWKGYVAAGLDFNSQNGIALSFYVPNTLRGTDAAAASYMIFSFSNDAVSKTSPANRSKHTIYLYEVRNGWNYIRLRPDNLSSDAVHQSPFVGAYGWSSQAGGTGAVMTTAANWLSIDMYNMKNRDVYMEGVYRGGSNRPKMVWMFDNWGATVQGVVDTLFPSYGWKWVIDVPDDFVKADSALKGRMTTSAGLGAELVLNDIVNRSLTGKTVQQIKDIIIENKKTFIDRGWTFDDRFFIYNNNVYDDNTVEGLIQSGICYARAGQNELWINNIEQGIPNPLRYGSMSMDNTNYATMKQRLDRALLYQSDFHWYQHDLVTGGKVGGGGQTGVAITSITSVGTTATVTTTANHGINTTGRVTIAGADQAEYNGTYNVTVTGLATFTYTFAGSATTPATGVITYSNVACSASLSQYTEDFSAFAAYVRQCELQGLLEVVGLTEWYDGVLGNR